MSRSFKAELADEVAELSPTIPNSSNRTQTANSTTPAPVSQNTPIDTPASMADSDATMTNGDHDAMRNLGADSYQLIKVIKKLEDLNIDATLPSLPKFVVVGDQSAGKSSVVEALCDISLPRGQGTCTRCPFLITTSSQMPPSGNWQCSVSIKQPFWFDDRNSEGHFHKRDQPTTEHFATVTNKAELETTLRRAQLAVLNPRQNPQTFFNADVVTAPTLQVAFSPNIIILEIQGPDLPEFSFYDLPGSINVVEDGEDQSLVKWIEKLISEYLKDEKTLILLACGADQDVETSTTFRYIKKCKAESRTAGVLTKVDLLSRDKVDYIREILTGRFFLGRGWFATKQLSQEEIENGVNARQREAELFSREPWVNFPGHLQERFGIPKLQEAVSRSLTDHIRGDLPEILSRVGERLSDINHQLVLFLDRPTHPTFTVMNEINQLASTVGNHLKGEGDRNVFRKTIFGIMLNARKQIDDAKPSVDWKTPGWKAPSLSLLSDDEDAPDATPTPLPQRPAKNSTPGTGRKRPVEATPSSTRRVKKEPSAPTVQKQKYTLDGLRSEYDLGSTSGVPDSVNSKVTDRLILQALSSWDIVIDRMLQELNEKLALLIKESIDNELKGRQKTRFYDRTTEVLADLVARLMHDERDRVHYLLACVQEKPITYTRWIPEKNARVREFESERRMQRTKEWFETHEADKARATPNDKRAEKAKDLTWVQTNLGDDEWDSELKSAAIINTYYDKAADTFVDSLGWNIEYSVMRPLRSDMARTLFEQLRADDAAECTLLLAEDPQREAERAKLVAEKGKLEKAMAELNGLGA